MAHKLNLYFLVAAALLLSAVAPNTSLARDGVQIPGVSQCSRWFQGIRERPRNLFRAYEAARDARIADIFPNALGTVETPVGGVRRLNHTPEQVAKFQESVDTYLNYRIRQQGYVDMERFRAWLNKTYGQPYPPTDSLDLRAWAESNLTIDEVLMRQYRTYQEERFNLVLQANMLPEHFRARSLGRRVAAKGMEYAQAAGTSFLGFAQQFAIGIVGAVLGTAGLTGSLQPILELPGQAQREVRSWFIDQNALNAVYRSSYRVIEEYKRENFTNDTDGFQRWTSIEGRLFGHLADISREAAKIRQPASLPGEARETRREVQRRYDETFSDLLEMQRARDTLIGKKREGNSSPVDQQDPEGLTTQIEQVNNVIQITRQSLARQLASWRLSVLFRRGFHNGQGGTPDSALEAENLIVNQKLTQLMGMGLFAEFHTAFGDQLMDWRRQSERLGLGQ